MKKRLIKNGRKFLRSFSLIEIIVVSTIFVLIALISFMSFSGFQKKSRDSKRKSDMDNVRGALEIYKNNNNNATYPSNLDNLVANRNIESLPLDPKTSQVYSYSPKNPDGDACDETTSNPCTTYTLEANIESEPDKTIVMTPEGTTTRTVAPTYTVQGIVQVQGRTDYSGATVTLVGSPGTYSATTNSSGNYTVNAPSADARSVVAFSADALSADAMESQLAVASWLFSSYDWAGGGCHAE